VKLHFDPISTTSRPVLLFLAEHDLDVEQARLDFMAGEHLEDAFAALNPNRQVPVLEDGDLVLTESAAILRYLADVAGSPAYPRDLKARARVNAAMDWINTQFVRDLGYNHLYPQVLPSHAFRSADAAAEVVERGRQGAHRWLAVMNGHMLAADRPFLGGDHLSLADYMGAVHVGFAEAVGFDLSPWPLIEAWLHRMKGRPSWAPVHAAFYGLVAAMRSGRAA
jgi:glutathione S-transferase